MGGQYEALTQGTVQAADVNTSDGELTSWDYGLLKDPRDFSLRARCWARTVSNSR